MNTDHVFTIGSVHVSRGTPCEDYAWSEKLDRDLVLGVVSDGCSGAFANTDIGARTISFAFARAITSRRVPPWEWFRGDFFQRLQANFASPRITDAENDYLATVAGFIATPEKASVFLMGDGAIAARSADGVHRLIEFDWAGNAPYYLGYTLNSERRARFLDALSETPGRAVRRRTTTFSVSESGPHILEAVTESLDFEDLETGVILDFRPKEQGILALAVMTDGVSHIGSISAAAAVGELLAFKNTRGGFVKRRVRKALLVFSKNGHAARDDIALACVWMGDADESK